MTNIELVMEVDSCLSEVSLHVTMELDCCFDHYWNKFLNWLLEITEVFLQERVEDREQ